ncbi:MAG: hypothetical protein A2W86_07230 [Bacteroidetes bacterium GWD2_45_23]|jgi:hypothetical protein|nr:MAG: hypothetical protein A2W87_03585 [Bacteroidetes bacterium GWC2_46_850]OFX82370.1 MAG: hypothetical protein A2W86_07230 [Bacteroidetes bacterium GWD2_45_23]
MSIKSNDQISQTISVTQLTKHHCKELIPTSEMLHIFVAIILANDAVKLASIQKRSNLSKNELILEHRHQFQY